MTDVIAGRFALCDPIARGGSGVVWRAYDRKLGRFCAAKVLRRRDAGDLLRFVREQSVRVTHGHVLAPYSWAAEDAHVVIASELVDGGSLSTLIGDYGPLSEATVAAVLDQLLEALEHVHAAGLIHRDVKPGNLLLRATGTQPVHVMLADFGLAMGVRDAHFTEIGTVVGTPGYLAPEVMRGGIAPDPSQDLFAAGRVAVALLRGIEPRDQAALVPEAAPGPLRAVVTALVAPDPRLRPPSAAHARAALRPALGPPVGPALGDPRPRTRGGDVIDVLPQLPPLSETALAEAGVGGPGPADAGPLATSPLDTRATLDSTDVLAAIRPATAALAASSTQGRARSPRRGMLLTGVGIATAAAITVPIVLAVTGSGGDATPSTQPSRKGAGRSSVPPGQFVQAGSTCDWQEQGNQEKTTAGTSVVCTRNGGGYTWVKR